MIPDKSLVVYKNRPALVGGDDSEKINITVVGGNSAKVREKDVELIHPGPCVPMDLEGDAPAGNVREVWELLVAENSPGLSLKELAELVYGVFSPRSAWAAWENLHKGLYFSGNIRSIKARQKDAVEEDEKKLAEKQKESGDRAAFLEKLKKLPPFRESCEAPQLTESERRFLNDVEALAWGRSEKSRTLKDIGKAETPEEAHRLLLASGAWTIWVNPHPSRCFASERFGFSLESAKIVPPEPPEEDRLDLTGLEACAIDSPWSDDPDDAVSLEGPDADGCYCLWVHVADPSASILPGTPADTEARSRGATLYLPEGPSRMLSPQALPFFTLGSSEHSAALSFKITLKPDLTIGEIEIAPSLIRVKRLSYAEADKLITGEKNENNSAALRTMLQTLSGLMERNTERRLDTGAVMIDFPDAHIQVKENRVSVEPIGQYRSADMIRECMILAGEGTARWALQRKLPFPFISQEAGELPGKRLPGLAGAWQLRRCMRPRALSAKPAVHWGLGLDEYTQVTSPLRRYIDLVCHQQIRAFLSAGAYRELSPLNEDEVLFRISAAEAAASAANRAERASRAHWLAVYLLDKKASLWDALVLDRKGNRGTVIIPALGFETQASLRGTVEPNEQVSLSLSSVRIPEGEVFFSMV